MTIKQISNKYQITFKSTTKKGKGSEKTATFYGNDEARARANFEADATKMLKFRGIAREFISISATKKTPTFSAPEDFAARYGFAPLQYEEE